MYHKSGLEVPIIPNQIVITGYAKSQIDTLEKKLGICFSKISENPDKLSEEKVDLKGKGKEIDLKGKRKS